jgi:hypothetical protein
MHSAILSALALLSLIAVGVNREPSWSRTAAIIAFCAFGPAAIVGLILKAFV